MYKTRIKEKWWFSQCGRTWLVCRKQLNTSGVTLNEPQTHHQTPMTCTYGYSHFIHTKTVATEVEIKMLSTWMMFPSLLAQFGSAFFSSKEGGTSTFVHIMNVQVIGVCWWVCGSFKVTPEVFSCFLQTSQVLPHWLNHHFSLILVLYTETLSC